MNGWPDDDGMPWDAGDWRELDMSGRPARRGPVDLEGRPVRRTKASHPYSYDGHVVTRVRRNAKRMECNYTDRLAGWDREKYQRLCRKHLDKVSWASAPPEKVEEFLREWEEDPGLELVAVMEWCNASSGYPTWSLHFKCSREKQAQIEAARRRRKEED